MDEHAEDYIVDVADVPRGGKRRRKSMEPAALQVIAGNIISTPNSMTKKFQNRPSMGRASMASTAWGESPVKGLVDLDDEDDDDSWLDTPIGKANAEDKMRLQQTMPVNKIKKMQFKENSAACRRLTTWEMQD